ncbi:MAG: hypothetical protein IEMM0002_0112 [bacterium]|nr:MAG: hypothetical protein IEMM0002_0112 [bacterium]
MWRPENELSRTEKIRRSLYNALRHELETSLLQFGLIDPYTKFLKTNADYKFVEKRELKPRGKVTEAENDLINGFIVLFAEAVIPSDLKKYVRYFDNNKVTKENLQEIVLTSTRIAHQFEKAQKYFDHPRFFDLMGDLLPVDYALLIQQDTTGRSKNRYTLSHFHVRIDWLIDFATESLAKQLRYISKDLYEKGEKYAHSLVEKLFEYFSFHHTVSGRRTAAVVAYQLLCMADFITTVYVNSAESRTLTKLAENGVSKFCLVKIPKEHIELIEKNTKLNVKNFRKNFLIHEKDDFGVGIFHVFYKRNEHTKPPADSKLRELQSDVKWLRVASQLLVPKPGASDQRPINYSIIYHQQDPFIR